jgi:hypothetical protein
LAKYLIVLETRICNFKFNTLEIQQKKNKYAKYMLCQEKNLYFAFLKSPKQHGREHSENFLKESPHFKEESYEIIKL